MDVALGMPLPASTVAGTDFAGGEARTVAALRVLLVDDHEFIRVGVRSAYAHLGAREVEWVEAGTLAEALHIYAHSPIPFDAVLLDLNLGDCKGLQGLRDFLRLHPRARIAVFSATHDEFVVRQALALGAVAYVSKSDGASGMEVALRQLLLGQIPPTWPGDGAAGPAGSRTSYFHRVADLGPRHLEILELLLSGCTNQEISHATRLSLGTVKNYVSSLLLALDVKSRSHLISLFR